MAHHKSCIKRIKTNEKRRLRNRAVKSVMRKVIKKVRRAETKEEATQLLSTAFSHLDKAAKRRIIHPNMASRTKSRLAKFVQNLA